MLRRFLRWLIGPAEQPQHPPADYQQPLEAQVVILRSKLDALETEWHDVLDKINRWAARENARKRRSVARTLEASGETPTDGEIVAPEGFQSAADRKTAIRQRVAQLHARG